MDTNNCGVCKTIVNPGSERVKAGTSVFHAKCFVCKECKNELESFIRSKDGSLICDECDIKLNARKCFKCQLPIQSTIVTARGKSFHNDCFNCASCEKIIKGGFFFVEGEFYCSTCDAKPSDKTKTTTPPPSEIPLPGKSGVSLANGVEIQVPNNSTNIIYVLNTNESSNGLSSSGGSGNSISGSGGTNTGSSTSSFMIHKRNNSNELNVVTPTATTTVDLLTSSTTTTPTLSPSTLSPPISTARFSNDYLISLQDDIYAKQQQQLLLLQQQQIQIQQQLQQQQLEILQKNQSLLNSSSPSPSTSSTSSTSSISQSQNLNTSQPNITQQLSNLNISNQKNGEIEKYIPKINGKTLTELLKHQSFDDILGEVLSKKISIYKELSKEEVAFGDVIASGASGKVYKGIYKGRDVAIKVYSSENFCFNIEEFDREVTIMSLIDSDHPNFTRFYGANKQNKKYLFHVSELVKSGSLRDLLLDKEKPLAYFTQLSIASDIANAMKHLHSIGVIHRDLKSLNVLITEDFTAKVIDFGTSRNVDLAKQMTLNLGTSCYMSPELFKGNGYDETCDVYAFGIVLWEIIARKEPYENINSWSIPVLVAKGERPTIPADCPSEYSKLIKACWTDKPKKRPSFKEICDTLKKISESLTLKRNKK
ncbi:LIM-type zinc finger-containing protein [Dictyostelium discoideum AX4]|uniref:Probable LIM domain-containing serine/threonine-protein kinase DDB_G0287001 n=1 Tax=Dictyostelium discoideum TaxID=44689 RepID=LIMKA_DICDI|nr:LIM-type zinc finger-containing protein [Dictyostelium discoideum AX4]Q54L00.1 RecName: Full=Probable LIM domain-containing serine/threonine-protein kinase DDB_G0287001 [Dictyostelium discoideum]EAL63927.1 LIM-type zinc finger-containing protein [Dictyostelium discoideum AX4]|eukprot:XP_637432.1 LIM-type zinc finger-containing protein [Dictyostelium discoideum AX4]